MIEKQKAVRIFSMTMRVQIKDILVRMIWVARDRNLLCHQPQVHVLSWPWEQRDRKLSSSCSSGNNPGKD
jgi:hypothetical protein